MQPLFIGLILLSQAITAPIPPGIQKLLNSSLLSDRKLLLILPRYYPTPQSRTLDPVPIDFGSSFIDYFIQIRSVEVVTSIDMKSKQDIMKTIQAKFVLLVTSEKDIKARILELAKMWNASAKVLIVGIPVR